MDVTGKVTVICIAYNHTEWIEETLESVRLQDYHAKELIVVDNGSKDDTAEKIRNWVNRSSGQLSVHAIFNEEMQPYCQLFNQILAKVDSQYLIDLSGDDVLYPEHLSASIRELQSEPKAAFVFSDAYILDHMGEVKSFYKRNHAGDLEEPIELGDLYVTLIQKSYICAPTVVFNASILRKEGGYDESLFYEDFDILVRLARNHPVLFSDHIGVLKRKHARSMSAAQYRPYHSKMLPSTVKVCSKIHQMNVYPEENKALEVRVLYELKHALWSANFEPARELVRLGEDLGMDSLKFRFYRFWAEKAWDISWLYTQLR
ncbi:glycosyltransferase [Algoriphagus sp. H41]|uniref:Glycosyltransferase n=1 Tax=Algoriphagus oliviformis TaxID=2811231 RepID=A0ABS3C3E7_9BACT|nr:glycosyltransferase [Algoriphagus oliviformis]MBN7811632.1 glycosyltransferase [Algoriphagus oliviformis]